MIAIARIVCYFDSICSQKITIFVNLRISRSAISQMVHRKMYLRQNLLD